MSIHKFLGVENAKHATGVTIIIDVLRAATTAAFFLDKGVAEIIPVATKQEAFALKKAHPSYLLAGEEWGVKVKGFDFGNSPFEVEQAENLEGKTIIQRTTRGTQGIVQAKQATEIIFGSFVCCSSILSYAEKTHPREVSIVATMEIPGTEDDLFADYLIAKLENKQAKDIKEIVEYMKTHPHGAKFLDPNVTKFSEEDFYLAHDLDRFDFFPIVRNGRLVKYR